MKNGKTLSIMQQIQLVRPYSAGEVKVVIFSINETKSPGPNGYGSDSYKASWSIVGEEVTNAVLELLDNGQLLTR